MAAARQAVMDFVKPYLASELEEIDVLIALQEALVNAALHGCHNDPGKTIHCSVEIDPAGVTITIRDPGPGFDVDAVTQSTEAGANMTEHGRGIILMRSLMDDIVYRNGGSEVRLRKLRGAGS
jgi:serine/threonine-protein kinase RsbW